MLVPWQPRPILSPYIRSRYRGPIADGKDRQAPVESTCPYVAMELMIPQRPRMWNEYTTTWYETMGIEVSYIDVR